MENLDRAPFRSMEIVVDRGSPVNQNCFTEALKEYVPGKLIQGTAEQDGTETKMCCLKGALAYFFELQAGVYEECDPYQVGSLPYEIRNLLKTRKES